MVVVAQVPGDRRLGVTLLKIWSLVSFQFLVFQPDEHCSDGRHLFPILSVSSQLKNFGFRRRSTDRIYFRYKLLDTSQILSQSLSFKASSK
jgi:hypothetical protein